MQKAWKGAALPHGKVAVVWGEWEASSHGRVVQLGQQQQQGEALADIAAVTLCVARFKLIQ